MRLVNESGLKRPEHFLRFMLKDVDTTELQVVMKPISVRKMAFLYDGLCEGDGKGGFKITAAINHDTALPIEDTWTIRRCFHAEGTGKFKWHYSREPLRTKNEIMVWVLGHEVRHYLGMSGIMGPDTEYKANLYGFYWVRKYRKFYGLKSS